MQYIQKTEAWRDGAETGLEKKRKMVYNGKKQKGEPV